MGAAMSPTRPAADQPVEQGDGAPVLAVLKVQPGHPRPGVALAALEGPVVVGDDVGEHVGLPGRRAGAQFGENRLGDALAQVDIDDAGVDRHHGCCGVTASEERGGMPAQSIE